MRIIRTILSTAVFLLVAVVAYAQLSDQQVVNEVKRLQATGASQQQILTELAAKGVTREQAERIYADYQAQGATQTGTVVNTESRTRGLSEPVEPEVIVVQETPSRGPISVFGKNLFASKNLTFQPNMNMPTPENYELGAGDEVIIDIWGNSELTVRQEISPDGYINVTNIGPIYLQGMDVKEASAKIKTAFGRIYSDLRSAHPRTFIKTSVGNVRSIKVNIMGEVVLPGTYTLSSFASVFHALYSAGGINDIGSLRNVKVFRKGQLEKQVDVYDYLLSGDSSGDIILKENDIVKVEPFTKRVQITGQVKRPMIYEMLENEPMSRLIEYAGGFTSDAYKKNVQLTRLGTTERKVYTVEIIQYESFALQDGDEVSVGSILERYENRVEISGAVFRPGAYALDERVRTLKDLVTIAEGPTEDAFLGRAILNRENPDLSRTVESVDLGKLLAGEIPDIVLKRNDRLYVMSEDSLRQDYTVTLEGEVMNPGTYPYALNMSIEDLIITGGGLLESASLMKVDVARRTRDPLATNASNTTSEIYSFTIENGLVITGDKGFTLHPFDIVAVRRSPGYQEQERVSLLGEVVFPGNYSKKNQNERLSSFIKRAGGVTPEAYIKGATLVRQMDAREQTMSEAALRLIKQSSRDSIMVDSIDLTRTSYYVGIDLEKIMEKPGRNGDIVMKAGDVVHIPIMNNVVKISGGVMYPNAVTYREDMSLNEYIDNAGGFVSRARRSKVYVVYMNNTVSKGRGSKIEPGCEIIVPVKPERDGASWGDVVGVTTSVLSVISLTVATLLNVSRINPSN
ncbi:MAG: SLBB domain-containing protein [Bacteroidales bacterium]|nr:SLBB domain-containing protein [Bacteroidales bacterium]